MRQVTIQNKLDPVYTWIKTRFQFEIVIVGKRTIIEILFIFSVERKETN